MGLSADLLALFVMGAALTLAGCAAQRPGCVLHDGHNRAETDQQAASVTVTSVPTETTLSASAPLSVTPSPHEGMMSRHEQLNALSAQGKARLVFLGDSITQGWEGEGSEVWAERYAARDGANFGASGDCTEQVLWRLNHGNMRGLRPRLIVLMIGTNNTGQREEPADETAAGVRAILDRLAEMSSESKVLLLGIFPREASPTDPMRLRNAAANRIIASFDDGRRVFYRDIGDRFVRPDGSLRLDLMPDNLHLNAAGYRVWAEAIEPDVRRLMGE